MGSLYDIGNFRYKHFTFYGCGDDECHIHTGDETYNSSGELVEENLAKKIHHDVQIKNYLNAVWPWQGIYGFGSEGDHAYITYISQSVEDGKLNTKVENIYVYRRLFEDNNTEPIWQLSLQKPLKTLNLDFNS